MYYLIKSNRPNIIDLTKTKSQTSAGISQYSLNNICISKATLVGIKTKYENIGQLLNDPAVIRTKRKILEVKEENGKFQYYLSAASYNVSVAAWYREEIVEMNNIIHKNDNIWLYYIKNNPIFIQEEREKQQALKKMKSIQIAEEKKIIKNIELLEKKKKVRKTKGTRGRPPIQGRPPKSYAKQKRYYLKKKKERKEKNKKT